MKLARGKNRVRPAFSLAELVISVGILILMMALAGQVFTITIKSTGQATALTEITQQLRVLEETLRADLRGVQPGQSVMLIQGNPVNAYWTQAGREADDDNIPANGYGHLRDPDREWIDSSGNERLVEPRADILMFFTARKGTSAINPSISSRVQQVVYGHTDLGEIDANTDTFSIAGNAATSIFPVDDSGGSIFPSISADSDKQATLPANQWHLGRRSILLLPTPLPQGMSESWELVKSAKGLEADSLIYGKIDVVSEFSYEDVVLKPFDPNTPGWGSQDPWFLPSVFGNTLGVAKNAWHKPYARCKLDTTPPMMMSNRMGSFLLPNCASFKVEWSLDASSPFVAGRLDRTSEVFWFDPGDTRNTLSDPKDDEPLYSLYARIEALKQANACEQGHPQYQLCLDLSSLLCEQTVHADGSNFSLADRFWGKNCDPVDGPESEDNITDQWKPLELNGIRPNMAAFTASRETGKCSLSKTYCLENADCPSGETCIAGIAPDDIWPGALRITVDLYDREGRLDRPIRHVMVIPVGE